jgi:2-keto-4-pentenoate hydratase/2-oxohepta-3-ene-1,7-dioic acid hydratase in catechol pathway
MEEIIMKFVRYEFKGVQAYGILEDNFIKEISGSIFGDYEPTSASHRIDDVRLISPVEPSKIICVGLNYKEHIKELNYQLPEFPSHFLKPLTAIIGPEDSIIYPRVAEQVYYEGELALVIKDTVKDISEAEAIDHVFGYTCFNDVTERRLAKIQGQLTRAKGFDTFASFGPCIATDLDPSKLTVQTFLNGTLVQEGQTSDMLFSVSFLVHYLSQCMTLLPGDIISTGTPKGVGPMNPGDIVEVSVDGIGILKNLVKSEI